MTFPKKNSFTILLLLLLVTGAFFRFYNLNWGAPFYFHPDERNIANAVSAIQIPSNLNPHFFAYGSLPIYSIAFLETGLSVLFKINGNPFENAIVLSRFLSALFSTLLIPLSMVIAYTMHGKKTSIITGIFVTTSIGLIQYAHFGTFEIWLTFFSTLLFFVSILYVHQQKPKYLLYAFLLIGALTAIKISSIILIPILPLIYCLVHKPSFTKKFCISFLGTMFSYSLIALLIFLLLCPFTILDFKSFQNTMNYESSVALGTLNVFYTQGFMQTTPVLFQFLYDYPFLINPLITLLFIPSFLYVSYKGFLSKNNSYKLLIVFYFLLFFSQAFLFVKWIRYIVPTLPFMYIIIAIACDDFLKQIKKPYGMILFIILSIICLVYSCAFFSTTYMEPDTRVQAAQWAKRNLQSHAQILSESYDLGIVPFNASFDHITLFNFYDMDTNISQGAELQNNLANTEYIIIPSQRVIRSRFLKPHLFPKSAEFYSQLFMDHNNYKIVYQTPCDFWCKLVYSGNEIYHVEETADIFDRPTITIIQHEKN